MSKLFIIGLALLLVAPLVASEIAFVDNYAAALADAQAKNQDIVITFHTEWCTWCKVLDTITYRDEKVIDFSKNFVFVGVDAEKDTVTANKYGIAGYPTIILCKPDGTEIDRIYGYVPPEDYLEIMNDYLQGKNTLADFLAQAETNPTMDLYYKLADKYVGRKDYANGEKYYRMIMQEDPSNEKGYSDSAMMSLGEMKTRAKEYDVAQEVYNDMIKAYPESDMVDDAVYQIGVTLNRAKKYDEAIDHFKKFIQNYPESDLIEDAEIYVGYCNGLKGDTTTAISSYEKFLADHPDSQDADWVQGQIDKLKSPPKDEESE